MVDLNGKEMTAEEMATKMTADYEATKKSNPELIAKTRAIAKGIPKPKAPKKEVTPMTGRQRAEQILIDICKELKLAPPRRVSAKADSKSGLGALQAFTGVGIKVAVRSHDVVAYLPQSELGFGAQAPGRWVYVTILKYDDPNLDKAFRKALKDKVASTAWAKQLGFAPRAQAGKAQPEDLEARRKRVENELAAIKMQLAKQTAKPKAKKKAKVVATATPAILAAVEAVAGN